MKNREWFNSLSDEFKARWLALMCRRVASEYYHENQKGTWKVSFWKKWLDSEHNDGDEFGGQIYLNRENE